MIREIKEDELFDILKLYEQLGDNPLPKDSKKLEDVCNKIIEEPNYHIVVCTKDLKVVSSCTIVIIPNLTHNRRPYALVENVVTDEKYRKRGLATDCLNYAKDIAKKSNCYKMMLLTGSKREGTLNFYKKAGYNMKDKTAFVMWL